MLNLSLLGPFQAEINGHSIHHLKVQKAKGLLIFLAVEANQIHQREFLMSLLWPDSPLKSAQQNMRQALYLLRKNIGIEDEPSLFLAERFTISWNPAVPLSLDITQFENLAHSDNPDDWRQVVALYRGHFLADFYIPDSEPFETWAAYKRAVYLDLAQTTMVKLTSHYIVEGKWQDAESIARRLLELDELQETAHRSLIEILARSGRRQEALRQFDTLTQLLKDELGIEPDADTITLVNSIRDGSIVQTANAAPAEFQLSEKPKHNLHYLLTGFIDRDREIPDIETLVTNQRLVVLTGAAGIGKTKLCIKVGWNLLELFPDGVWLVELAPVKDPKFIPQAIAAAMGLKEISGRPVEEIVFNVLRESHCLLILDNCEHLIEAAAQTTERILRTCPDVKILASSLEAFKFPGEHQFSVPSLSYPKHRQRIDPSEWEKYDAIRLFAERAKAVSRDFQITEQNFASVTQICQRLDGIPLAIELAAARVNVLSVADIAARLDDRFNLLVGGNRTGAPRHQTLRSLMEWSWDLLTRPEKELLKRLSVFVGGMDLQAVEAAWAWGGMDDHQPLELLTQLVDKSFVSPKSQPGKETRYYLLESIQQYAREQLEKIEELEHYQDCHLAYFNHLGDEAGLHLVGLDQVYYLKIINSELDNIRAALAWAYKVNIEAGVRLIASIWRFLHHGYVIEGEMWLARFLAQTDKPISPSLKADALYIQARFNFPPNASFALARSLLQESLSIYQNLQDQKGIAYCLGLLGYLSIYIYSNLNERGNGQRLLHQSLEIFRSLENKLGIAEALNWLGTSKGDRNYEEAMIYLEESITLLREVGPLVETFNVLNYMATVSIWHGKYQAVLSILDEVKNIQERLGQRENPHTTYNQGRVYYRLGDYQSAQENLEKTIFLSKQTGDHFRQDWALVILGYVFLRMGKLEAAREIFVKSMRRFTKTEMLPGVFFASEGIASLNIVLQKPEKAAKLFAWADKQREAINLPRPSTEQEDVENEISKIIEMIGEQDYAVACEQGRNMTMRQAIDFAAKEK